MEIWWSSPATATAATSFTSSASRIGYSMVVIATMPAITATTTVVLAMIRALAAVEPTWSPNGMWKPDESLLFCYISGKRTTYQRTTTNPRSGNFVTVSSKYIASGPLRSKEDKTLQHLRIPFLAVESRNKHHYRKSRSILPIFIE